MEIKGAAPRISRDATTTVQVVSAILRETKSPYTSCLLNHVVCGEWLDVVNYPMPDPLVYTDSVLFARDYLAWNLLRKADFLPCGIDTKGVALKSFLESEEQCRLINDNHGRNPHVTQSDEIPLDRTFEAVIHTAKVKIAKLLGDFSWDDCERHFGFSGGASTRLKRKSGHPFYKYQGKPDVTPSASVLGCCAMWVVPAWRATLVSDDPSNWVNLVRGSKAETVPKSAKTDRFICIEPDLNMYTQRGIGALIRKALKRARIDLDDQTLNQHLALVGSRTGSLATIDLKAASDSISTSIVEALLPVDWFAAMDLTRSPYTRLPDGSWHRLEKISSMGNGYTFELESLIFWGLSSAVIDLWGCEDKRLGVYGDDIVIHHSVVTPLVEVLSYCGFTVNTEKSFSSGPFRESCGKHYFYGRDVTPFNIKEEVGRAERINWLVNTVNLWLSRGFLSDSRSIRILRYILKRFRHRVYHVPGNLSSEAGIFVPSVNASRVYYSLTRQALVYKCLIPVRQKHKPQGSTAVLTWLSQKRDNREPISELILQKGSAVYRSFTRSTAYWPDVPVRFVITSADDISVSAEI